MEYAKAASVLQNLMEKPALTAEEKEAVFTAIGVLAWVSLAKPKKRETGKGDTWERAPEETPQRTVRKRTPKS